MAEADPPHPGRPADADEHRWLARFLLAGSVTAASIALVGWIAAAGTGLPPGPELVTLVIVLIAAPVLLVAHLAVRASRAAEATVIVIVLMLSISLGVALFIPVAVAQPSILAVLGFVLARQYLRGPALRAVGVACWAVSVVAIGIILVRSGLGDSWTAYLFGLVPISATLALLFAVLTVFAERTARALAGERSSSAQLDASRRFAGQVTEAVPGIVMVYEIATGVMTYANGVARRFVGEPIAVGEPVLAGIVERAVHPSEQPAMQAWHVELGEARDDGIRTASARLQMDDGWRWFDIRGKVFRRDPDGRPTHVLVLGLDASSERTATLQRDRFFDLAGDAFVVVGADARIVEGSGSLAAMLGVEPDRLVGLSMREAGHPDDREAAAELMGRLARGQPRGSVILRHRNPAGEWRSIEWTLAIDPEDLLMYGAARDVTERLATRDAFEKVRRLETVGRLAGGVAHDVNNSLTAIGGFAALIADATPDPEVRELAGEIRAAVDRTALMTRKLLAFSRRQAQAPRVVDLGAVLRDLRPMVNQLMTAAVAIDLDIGEAPHVLVDPAGVEQIVLNLAVNARDAMPDGGRITIRTGPVELAETGPVESLGPGTYAELVVADTGSGMPEAVRSRIFEPFFSTKGDAGTGLGLAIVHGLVTGAGGAIDVTSAPGRGTTVRILLPAADGVAGVPSAPVSAATGPVVPRHVLVVEDEPTIRRLAQAVLERAGHRVTVAEDGDAALAALTACGVAVAGGADPQARHDEPDAARTPIDLVITDIVMPGMSGIDLARRIRALYPDLPIAFASGYDQGLLPVDGPFAGARLLEKPYSPSLLVAAVSDMLD